MLKSPGITTKERKKDNKPGVDISKKCVVVTRRTGEGYSQEACREQQADGMSVKRPNGGGQGRDSSLEVTVKSREDICITSGPVRSDR